MGVYINPKGQNKEDWLRENGKMVTLLDVVTWKPDGKVLPVVLMDNGLFTAAGVAYSLDEVGAFTSPEDKRRKKFYFVEIEKLWSVSNLKDYMSK